MLGGDAFSEVSFSETAEVTVAEALGSLPIIYFNSSTLTFPLNVNILSSFNLNVNQLMNLSLNINTLTDLDLNINTLQDHELTMNQMMNFTARR